MGKKARIGDPVGIGGYILLKELNLFKIWNEVCLAFLTTRHDVCGSVFILGIEINVVQWPDFRICWISHSSLQWFRHVFRTYFSFAVSVTARFICAVSSYVCVSKALGRLYRSFYVVTFESFVEILGFSRRYEDACLLETWLFAECKIIYSIQFFLNELSCVLRETTTYNETAYNKSYP